MLTTVTSANDASTGSMRTLPALSVVPPRLPPRIENERSRPPIGSPTSSTKRTSNQVNDVATGSGTENAGVGGSTSGRGPGGCAFV